MNPGKLHAQLALGITSCFQKGQNSSELTPGALAEKHGRMQPYLPRAQIQAPIGDGYVQGAPKHGGLCMRCKDT